jgi:hypothetical protein
MEIKLKRYISNSVNTIGKLTFPSNGDAFLCHTLELSKGEGLEYGLHGHCISAGRYRILMQPSPKFDGLIVPHLQAVPGRQYILMHYGCFAKDTEGCILTGRYVNDYFINHSRDEFDQLIDILYRADDRGEKIWITIED